MKRKLKQKKKYNFKKSIKETGITLISLIITVILLVILSLVGISVVYNSRIIEFAINGTQKYGQEGINENKLIDETGKLIESVVDNIGKDIDSEIPKPSIPQNTSPTKAVVSFNSKGTNYIKVNAKSEDTDGDQLTYTLYYGTDQNNLDISTELSEQTQNVQVSIQTEDNLSEYTYYYWRVDVSDGKVTTKGDVQMQVRTYCQGTGISCPGSTSFQCPVCKEVDCMTICNGSIIAKNDGRHGDYNACNNCGVYNDTLNWYLAWCTKKQKSYIGLRTYV